jgi:putative membrane protein
MSAVSAILSAIHLLALAVGLPAIVFRAALLRAPAHAADVHRALAADTAWGVAAVLWIVTGPARAFGPFDKGAAFYLSSPLFTLKIALFLGIFLIEITPMVALIRWRMALGRGAAPDLAHAPLYATLSWIEAALVVAIVFVASFMARGFGLRG